MTNHSTPVLMFCLLAGLLSACSRSETTTAKAPVTITTPAPLTTEASVTTNAPPVGDRPAGPAAQAAQAAQAAPVPTPPEDRMEPASLENARLPGGGKLPPDPDGGKR